MGQLLPNPNPKGKTLNTEEDTSNSSANYWNDGVISNLYTLTNDPGSVINNAGNFTNWAASSSPTGALHGIIDNNGEFWNGFYDSMGGQPAYLLNLAGATVNNNSLLANVSVFSNSGVLNNNDLGSIVNSRVLDGVAHLDNKAGGAINNNYGSTLTNSLSAVLTNGSGAILTNDGTIYNADNSLGAKGFINNGTYQGTGSIKGSWTDHGHVKPGSSAGGMLVDGHYYKKGGSKEIELAGTYHGDGDRTATEHDWIEITGDLELAGKLDVSLIDGFKLSAGDSFVITKVDGDLSGQYDGLDEGDSVGRFKSDKGAPCDLFITYQGGDGNDIELYTKSLFGDLPKGLREPRIIGSAENDLLSGTSANEVIFGANGDDILLGRSGDDHVTGGNGNDRLDGGSGDDKLKGDRGADTYTLSRGDDVIIGFSFAENDRISVGGLARKPIFATQVGDDLLLKGNGVHTTLLDVDRVEFFVADVIDFI
ncbi:calcium-binding protein [Prochlorococcus marinus]|uniref:Uncharacterized protein n=1 Tax=Prochlorococcus marinus (strain MIT 9303) TaxID=59922 RepID=A2CB11_PROM3|nr:hypothetical protein [Prochlorococcus marinus]ABM78671.1 Hypothetical protein P9303_19291 [Prochlorococcus marinus str. MIT 9303]